MDDSKLVDVKIAEYNAVNQLGLSVITMGQNALKSATFSIIEGHLKANFI